MLCQLAVVLVLPVSFLPTKTLRYHIWAFLLSFTKMCQKHAVVARESETIMGKH